MPICRAAAEIEPVAWIASNRAILPGPMRSPLVRSMRMLRRVSAMGPGRRYRERPEHREAVAGVKGYDESGRAADRVRIREHGGTFAQVKRRPFANGRARYIH